MKPERLMVFVSVLGMLLCLALAARADDKDMHMLAGVAIGGGLSIGSTLATPEVPLWKRSLISSGLCLAAGAGKEALDEYERAGGADAWDMAATAGGCAAGLVIGGAFSELLGRDDGGEVVSIGVTHQTMSFTMRF